MQIFKRIYFVNSESLKLEYSCDVIRLKSVADRNVA